MLFSFHRKGCNEYVGSVFHKINKDLETGVQMSWLAGSGETAFGFGTKYNLDKDTIFKVSVEGVVVIAGV